jgi:hypothetical protein
MRPRRLYFDQDKDKYYYIVNSKKKYIRKPKTMSQRQLVKINIKNIIGDTTRVRRVKRRKYKKQIKLQKKIVPELSKAIVNEGGLPVYLFKESKKFQSLDEIVKSKDKDDVKMNAKRQVQYVSAKEWVKSFNERNSNNFLDVKTLFTPTTIMETENRVYAFVIHTVDLNSCDKVVFTVSTKEISLQNNTSKKLIQLPLGKCNNVRFDIDTPTDCFVCWFLYAQGGFAACSGCD